MDTRLPSLDAINVARKQTAVIQRNYRIDKAKDSTQSTKRSQMLMQSRDPVAWRAYRDRVDKARVIRIALAREGVPQDVLAQADAKKRALLDAPEFTCYYCKQPVYLPSDRTTDHITAISCGGKHTPDNIVPSCRSCNSRKNVRSDWQY